MADSKVIDALARIFVDATGDCYSETRLPLASSIAIVGLLTEQQLSTCETPAARLETVSKLIHLTAIQVIFQELIVDKLCENFEIEDYERDKLIAEVLDHMNVVSDSQTVKDFETAIELATNWCVSKNLLGPENGA